MLETGTSDYITHLAILYQGQAWFCILQENDSIKVVEEYILTSTKSGFGNIGGKLLDSNHYYKEKGFVSCSTFHVWVKI